MRNGFSLIEVIVAVFLISVGLVAAFSLINQTIYYTQTVSSRLTAIYLAQEGLEIVKNIRDSNFLNVYNWKNGLNSCESGCRADYNSATLNPAWNTYLRFDGNFYSYNSGPDTKFRRKITVTPDGSDILNVSVDVSWSDKGRPYNKIIEERLYNWQQQ